MDWNSNRYLDGIDKFYPNTLRCWSVHVAELNVNQNLSKNIIQCKNEDSAKLYPNTANY